MDISSDPPPDGFYRTRRKKWAYMKIADGKMSYHETGKEVFDGVEVKLGEFDTAEQSIKDLTGKEKYNLKLIIYYDKKHPDRKIDKFGVISDDRERLFFVNNANKAEVDVSERITEEEAAEIERSGLDPIAAPPGPYILQPSLPGRLIWLTGAAGAGKSTSAQLLARHHGFVYYEVDCFRQLRNPFIPLDVPNPTMVQDAQRVLGGEGAEERKEVSHAVSGLWEKCLQRQELTAREWEDMERFHGLLCQDVLAQRRRIGGDWALAGCVPHRRMRDVVRSVSRVGL